MKFRAKVHKTRNDYEVPLHIEETICKEDVDGFVFVEGEKIEHILIIEGHNAQQRANILAKQINRL